MRNIATDAEITGIRLEDQASDPDIPAADHSILYKKVDGLYVRDSSGTVEKVGGEGSTYTPPRTPDTPPEVPDPADDEFDNDVINPAWTVNNDRFPSYDINTTWPSMLYLKNTNNWNFELIKPFAPVGAFNIALCATHAPYRNYEGIHIYLFDSTEQNGLQYIAGFANGVKYYVHSVTNGVTSYNVMSEDLPRFNRVYMAIQRDTGNGYYFWVSFDGRSFYHQGVYNKDFTIAKVKIGLDSGGASYSWQGGIDWFRKDWGLF